MANPAAYAETMIHALASLAIAAAVILAVWILIWIVSGGDPPDGPPVIG